MRGLIKLTPESLISLTTDCMDYTNDFDISPYLKTELIWSWKHFKKIERKIYGGLPFWYQYKSALQRHFYKLYKLYEQAEKHGDEIWISELSYINMCLLKGGDRGANAIYIIDY